MALLKGLWENMPIARLLKEIISVMDAPTCDKTIKCITFEDKNGDIEIEKASKMRLKPKYTDIKHHHFRSCA